MRKPAILCDLDGTLCDCRHRLPIIEGLKDQWMSFYSQQEIWDEFDRRLSSDEPFNDVIAEVKKAAEMGLDVVYLSGRRHQNFTYTDTVKWLEKQKLPCTRNIFLREKTDTRPGHTVKRCIFEKYINRRWNVIMAFDDDVDTLKLWKLMGLCQ